MQPGGRPVLGVCVGMQVLFDGSDEPSGSQPTEQGLQQWPGTVARLEAPVVPHMGWSTVEAPAGTRLFDGVEDERFYFVHSYAPPRWRGASDAVVSTAAHGDPFVAAVEAGVLAGTQFHPEKSGDAGARLLANWVTTLD